MDCCIMHWTSWFLLGGKMATSVVLHAQPNCIVHDLISRLQIWPCACLVLGIMWVSPLVGLSLQRWSIKLPSNILRASTLLKSSFQAERGVSHYQT